MQILVEGCWCRRDLSHFNCAFSTDCDLHAVELNNSKP